MNDEILRRLLSLERRVSELEDHLGEAGGNRTQPSAERLPEGQSETGSPGVTVLSVTSRPVSSDSDIGWDEIAWKVEIRNDGPASELSVDVEFLDEEGFPLDEDHETIHLGANQTGTARGKLSVESDIAIQFAQIAAKVTRYD